MLQLLAQADGGTVGSIVLAALGLAAAVVKWLQTRAALAERDTHAAAALDRQRKLTIAHELIEVFHEGAQDHEDGANLIDSALMAAKSSAAQDLLEHLVKHGETPEIPALPTRTMTMTSSPAAAAAGMLFLTLTLGLSACSAEQLAAARANEAKLAAAFRTAVASAEATLASFEANESSIDELVADVAKVAAASGNEKAVAAAGKALELAQLARANRATLDQVRGALAIAKDAAGS